MLKEQLLLLTTVPVFDDSCTTPGLVDCDGDCLTELEVPCRHCLANEALCSDDQVLAVGQEKGGKGVLQNNFIYCT